MPPDEAGWHQKCDKQRVEEVVVCFSLLRRVIRKCIIYNKHGRFKILLTFTGRWRVWAHVSCTITGQAHLTLPALWNILVEAQITWHAGSVGRIWFLTNLATVCEHKRLWLVMVYKNPCINVIWHGLVTIKIWKFSRQNKSENGWTEIYSSACNFVFTQHFYRNTSQL